MRKRDVFNSFKNIKSPKSMRKIKFHPDDDWDEDKDEEEEEE